MNKQNYKSKNLTSQQESLKNPQPDVDFSENPVVFLQKEEAYLRDVLEVVLSLSDHFLLIIPSHEYIAWKSGVCLTRVKLALKFFKEHGILTWKRRFNNSNIYTVASCFFDFHFRSKLSHLFQWLKYIPVVLLLFLPEDIVVKEKDCLLTNTRNIENSYKRIDFSSSLPRFIKTILSSNNCKRDSSELLVSYVRLNMEQNPISPTIRNITWMNLTRWGQIRLMAFPEEAIAYALEMSKSYGDKVQNKFNWFFKVCSDYCDKHGIKQNWWLVEKLNYQYNMPVNPCMTSNKPLPKRDCLTRVDVLVREGLSQPEQPLVEQPSTILKRHFPESDIKPASIDALAAFVSPSSLSPDEQIAVKRATQAPAFKEKLFHRPQKGGRGEWENPLANKISATSQELLFMLEEQLKEPNLPFFKKELLEIQRDALLKEKKDTPQPPSMKRPQKHAELKSLGQMAINVLDQYNLPP